MKMLILVLISKIQESRSALEFLQEALLDDGDVETLRESLDLTKDLFAIEVQVENLLSLRKAYEKKKQYPSKRES